VLYIYCSLSLKTLSITNSSIKFRGNWQAVLVLERAFITITSPEGAVGCCYSAWSWEMQRASGVFVERGKEQAGELQSSLTMQLSKYTE
jgi:hypothetical protein